MNIVLQTKLSIDIRKGIYICTASRNGVLFDKIITTSEEALMNFAEHNSWGTFGRRELFETYVMRLRENPAYAFDKDLRKN